MGSGDQGLCIITHCHPAYLSLPSPPLSPHHHAPTRSSRYNQHASPSMLSPCHNHFIATLSPPFTTIGHHQPLPSHSTAHHTARHHPTPSPHIITRRLPASTTNSFTHYSTLHHPLPVLIIILIKFLDCRR